MANRLEPLVEPLAPEVAEVLAHFPKGEDGYVLSLFRTFVNSLRFARKAVANLLDQESPLTLRMREIIILRTTARNDCEYEWGVHVSVFAGAAKLGADHIAATRLDGPDATCWTAEECLALRAVDELCDDGGIAAATYEGLANIWTREQQLELIALVGNYHTISFVANTARLPSEPFGARFPKT